MNLTVKKLENGSVFLAFLFLNLPSGLAATSTQRPETANVTYGGIPVLNLCEFSSHNDFTSGLEDLLREQVTRALLFSHEQSLSNATDFVETLTTSEYTLLQVMYGLVTEDEVYSKLTCRLATKIDSNKVDELSSWLKDSFGFRRENLYEAMRNYARWNLDTEENAHLTKIIVFLAKDGSLDDVIVSQSDIETTEWLLKHGYEVSGASPPVDPPLHGAAEKGDLPGVKDLIGKGEKVNCTGRDGSTPLHKAAYWGHLDVVKELLSLGASLDCTDRSGETPLCWAVNGRRLPVIRELLGKGACVNCADKEGRTPLHSAAWWGNLPIVKELVKFGAEVNTRDSDGHTPLYNAEQMFSLDVTKLLRSIGGVL